MKITHQASRITRAIRKTLTTAGAALIIGSSVTLAQVSQFSQATHLIGPTNSGVLQSTPFQVFVPPISLNINASNNLTIVTNTINQVLLVTNSTTFIYNAATMGTNFSTNWAGYWVTVTNNTYGQAVPQSGGTNNCDIK